MNMFENELKSLGKLSEKIELIQQNVVKDSVNFEHVLVDVHGKVFDSQNLTIWEQVEKIGGAWKLFVGFMILTLPIFFAIEKSGIVSWLVILFFGSCFHIFPILHTYIRTPNTQKLEHVNWLLLYLVIWITWVPILGIIFWTFFWYLMFLWWWVFLFWCVVTFIIETKMEEMMRVFRVHLKELKQIHSWTILDMSLDFYSLTIYPQQVIKIRDAIEQMTAQIQKIFEVQQSIVYEYQRCFTSFWHIFFRRTLRKQIELFFQNESKQLLIYTNTFSQDLSLWQARHKMELDQLEVKIEE